MKSPKRISEGDEETVKCMEGREGRTLTAAPWIGDSFGGIWKKWMEEKRWANLWCSRGRWFGAKLVPMYVWVDNSITCNLYK